MGREKVTSTLLTIQNLFLLKDYYKNKPDLFAEDLFETKLLPCQRILVRAIYQKDTIFNNILSRQKQKELSYSTKARLTNCINSAVLGEKVLLMCPKEYTNRYLKYIVDFIESNINLFKENDITYNIKDNIIKFSTGGQIEIR